MKTDLDYLPYNKQADLRAIVEVIRDEYDQAVKLSTQTKKRMRGVLKIILFGSYATDTWVKQRWAPHQSDYDILIIVSHQAMLKDWDTLYRIQDRLFRLDKPQVGIIVETLYDINHHLKRGQFFFVDIRRQGVALWEAKGSGRLAQPGNLDPVLALDVAEEHYGKWMEIADEFRDMHEFAMQKSYWNKAAFNLHQTTECFYACALLVLSNYMPNSHNIKHLRSLIGNMAPPFIPIFPDSTRMERRRFELLKDAYVKSRYSKHYKITEEELTWLGERVAELRKVTDKACKERIAELERAVG